MAFDPYQYRAEFPILDTVVDGHPLTYLDNAATTQKPKAVIDAISHYYLHNNANVHRASHALSARATLAFEQARSRVQQFINAAHAHEIIWTRGATEAINLVAFSWAISQLKAGDEILISTMEHHANLVPWQQVCQLTGAQLKVIPLGENCSLDMERFYSLLNDKTRLVAVAQISNALGIINPIDKIVHAAHQVGAKVLVDGAQAAAHQAIDIQKLNPDFYVFSGHKMYGPTGIGVLYGKSELLAQMPPYQFGGEMIEEVSLYESRFNQPPFRFEAGTPNIAGVIGLAEAINYLQALDRTAIQGHEATLYQQAIDRLTNLPKARIYGEGCPRAGSLSFTIDGHHNHDVGVWLDQHGVAVRSGHHCAMPLMKSLNIGGTLRLSLALYNTRTEIDHFANSLEKLLDPALFSLQPRVNSSDNTITDWTEWQKLSAEKVVEQLSANSWNQRYRTLMQLGKQLPQLPEGLKQTEHQLHGCESKVWLYHTQQCDKHYFAIDSDARIIRGLIAVVLAAVNGHSCSDITSFDFDSYLEKLGLLKHLSPSRGNGLHAIIRAIKASISR